ncbi:hypothetical protein [Aureispira anguillae]|uniref:Uncharacterized protein n=1 Tax=Aureispira anguillae TaxID=2864201 RepID=A0A916DUR7_9BACT|nr:hypothetical protein [Aureispira anguillae]BDS12760.1 hypothetical protein AsAng_0034850 [Aureispira anguillae]
MKLKFEKTIKGEATGFAEKILAGLYIYAKGPQEKKEIKEWHNNMVRAQQIQPFMNSVADRFRRFPPKYHSLRSQKSPIKVGDEIEFLLMKTKSTAVEFCPARRVIAIQYVKLSKPVEAGGAYSVALSNDKEYWLPLNNNFVLEELARNDGFASMEALLDYFLPLDSKQNELSLKLVHWTQFRYPINPLERAASVGAEQ